MGEGQVILLKIGIALAGSLLLAVTSSVIAGHKGRDAVGWFLNGFLPGLAGLLILVFAIPDNVLWILAGLVLSLVLPITLFLLPALETPGQTRRCRACGKVAAWKAACCPACGTDLATPTRDRDSKVNRPLRRFYLLLFLFVLLLLIVFGFIGYFCVPNQPQG